MKENQSIKTPNFLFEGNISVKAAILANRREVYEIFVDKNKNDKDTNFIIYRAKEKNITVHSVDRTVIDEMCISKSHGGICAVVGERVYQPLCTNTNHYALIEGVEDPYNYAQIIRTLYALGISHMLVSIRNWNTASDVLVRASAGASEYINMVLYEDICEGVLALKQAGFTVIGGNRKNAVEIEKYHFPKKTLLCIGGEMRGLSAKINQLCDDFVYISYANDFRNSLTAVSATSILAYELYKQSK